MTQERTAQPGEPHRAAKRLGPFLCWAIVFADIGTSVYYTPGILFAQPGVGPHAALFVAMTLVVFVLLTRKYSEVAVRYPEGGGVVTVATRALHPFVGVVGGMFILVDYFLTAALSALSGIIYLSDVVPALTPVVLPATLIALVVLGTLNVIGISESARVNATFAVVAAVSQIAVVLAVIAHVGPGNLVALVPRVLAGPQLTPVRVLTGYAGAFLAFSGLESISQLSPVMAEPRRQVTRLAMGALIATMALTSPLLTLWSTTVLPITSSTDPNQFISLLGGFAMGRAFEIEVAMSGALLLVFASNTAIIGSYHVFLALARMGFLPKVIEQRNRWRDTPHWAILTVVTIPLLVLILAQGSVSLLGDLYAFGLLGAFSLTCLALDIVRWHERNRPRHAPATPEGDDGEGEADSAGDSHDFPPVGRIGFAIGVLTTGFVVLAWCINLVAKPLATEFGGGVSVVGVAIAVTTYVVQRRGGRTLVFPTVLGAHPPFVPAGWRAGARDHRAVLVLLPSAPGPLVAILTSLERCARGRPVVYLYRGEQATPMRGRIFEVVDPYLEDRPAQAAFAKAESLARRLRLPHRFVYLPTGAGIPAIREVWRAVQPAETLLVPDDAPALAGIPVDYLRHEVAGGATVRHYVKRWPAAPP